MVRMSILTQRRRQCGHRWYAKCIQFSHRPCVLVYKLWGGQERIVETWAQVEPQSVDYLDSGLPERITADSRAVGGQPRGLSVVCLQLMTSLRCVKKRGNPACSEEGRDMFAYLSLQDESPKNILCLLSLPV